jgi:hypothetical protein
MGSNELLMMMHSVGVHEEMDTRQLSRFMKCVAL